MVKCLQRYSTGGYRWGRTRPDSRYSRRIMVKRRQISTARNSTPASEVWRAHCSTGRWKSWHDRNGSTVHQYFRMRKFHGTKKRRGRQGPSR
jgi:hypothetical protein